MAISKEQFWQENQQKGSLMILRLDENDDQSRMLYEQMLAYRDLPLNPELFENEIEDEKELLSLMIFDLDTVISNAECVKAFLEERLEYLEEEIM